MSSRIFQSLFKRWKPMTHRGAEDEEELAGLNQEEPEEEYELTETQNLDRR